MPILKAAVVALGMFDGMHIGHRELIGRCVNMAQALGAIPAVYTFSNHPLSVLSGDCPPFLMNAAEREDTMRRLGIRDVRIVPFTRELAALPPEDFVRLLQKEWRMEGVVAGFNYSFGRFGAGTPDTLRVLGEAEGFAVEIVPPVMQDQASVSSTRIRSLIETGEVRLAATLLGEPYTLSGTVVKNRQIGRSIGFPTANIMPEADRVLPPDGVYVTEARIETGSYRAVTNVGKNPTVGGERLGIETHLIGFDGDLYGKTIRVSFLERIRGEIRFASAAELGRQIALDKETARMLKI